SASTTLLNVIGLARFDRFSPRLDCARKIVRMNNVGPGPVLQLLSCLAEILQNLTVEVLDLAGCSRRMHEPWNVVDDLPPGEFLGTQGFLPSLAILDVDIRSVPFDDFPRFVPQRAGAKQEPAICAVEAAKARFDFSGFSTA